MSKIWRFSLGLMAVFIGCAFSDDAIIPFGPFNHPYAVGRLYQSLYMLDRLFKENKITYWITDGTLLGAIRHGGFIPWDMDADLHIFQKDLVRFFSLYDRFVDLSFELSDKQEEEMKTDYILLQSRSRIHKKSRACIRVIPVQYDNESHYYLPTREKINKIWPIMFIWRPEEIESFRPYQFGPLRLQGPKIGRDYILRHYGKKVFREIRGGALEFTPLKEGIRCFPAYYDFATDELPIPPGSEKDTYFLRGRVIEGYSTMIEQRG